jgi:hypothetical protein
MSPEEKKEFFMKMQYERGMWHRGCCEKEEPGTEGKSEK